MNKKKFVGIAFIAIALLFINIIPDPTDVLTLQVYSAVTGADVSPSNLSSVYMDFIGWSLMVGLIFLFFGMWMLGWSFKRLWKKLDIEKYSIAIFLATMAVLFVAIFDIWSMNSGVFGTALDYTNGNYINGWWNLFYKFVLSFFSIVPICYWFFVKKDFSECLGVFGASFILYMGGLADIAYFFFQRLPFPDVLPWLNNHVFLGWLATTLGFTQVTNIVLYIGVFISFLIVVLYTKVLKEFF